LTSNEGSFLLISIHNAKVSFLSAFREMVPIENIGYLAESDVNSARSKRFIWTGPIAALTGLASQHSIDALTENAQSIIKKEDDDAREIAKLANKTNEMLGSIHLRIRRL
jgi:hypothetical protein